MGDCPRCRTDEDVTELGYSLCRGDKLDRAAKVIEFWCKKCKLLFREMD